MTQLDEEIRGHSVVLVGEFEPPKAHPVELLKNALVSKDDLAELKIDTILPDIVALSFGWIAVTVERNRLTVMTTRSHPMPEPVRDFVVDFLDLIGSSKVIALGINTDLHTQLSSIERWHEIGHLLVPKAPMWNSVLREPGTQSVTIRGVRDDGQLGHVLVTVEPSSIIQHGLYILVNDHFVIDPSDDTDAGDILIEG